MSKFKWFSLGVLTLVAFIGLYFATDYQSKLADAAQPVIQTYQGGTGTGTSPSSGQILLGQSDGTYAPVATSSLGFSSTYITVCSNGSCNYLATTTGAEVGINQAFTAASTTGGTILLKAGTYNNTATTSSNFRVNLVNNSNFIGEGDGTILQGSNNFGGAISLFAVNNVGVNNMQISGVNQTGSFGTLKVGLRVDAVKNAKISNNSFTNMNGFGSFVYADDGSTTTDISYLNNYFQGNGWQDLLGGGAPDSTQLSTTTDINVIGNFFEQTVNQGGTENINFDTNCMDLTGISRVNFALNNCKGNVVFGNEQAPNYYLAINSNIVTSPLGTTSVAGDIVIQEDGASASATRTPSNMIINNNLLQDGKIGLFGASVSQLKHVLVNGNSVLTSSSTEQNEENTGHQGIYASQVVFGNIYGNDITSNLNNGNIASDTGIQLVNTSSTMVALNNINGFATGIDLGNGSGNKSIFNNFTNVTTPIIGGTNIIGMNNFGQVYIGTSTAGYTLDLSNPSGTNVLRAVNNGTPSSAAGAGIIADTITPTGADNRLGFFLFGAVSTTTPTTSINAAGLSSFSSEAWLPGTNQGAYLKFETTPTASTTRIEQMRITANGNVGIGTTTPVANSQITNSVANSTTTLEFGRAGQNKGTCLKLYRADGSAIYAYVAAGATSFTLSTTACASVSGF